VKTIHGKGYTSEYGGLWLAVVPDDATSCTDPRGIVIVAPRTWDAASQDTYLQGYAARVKDEQRILEGRMYGTTATEGGGS
jgi:hypothetical protein